MIARTAQQLGLNGKRMSSGAGHDAQILALSCPTGMIFVPSQGGVSHNVSEFIETQDLAAGGDVLLGAMLELAE